MAVAMIVKEILVILILSSLLIPLGMSFYGSADTENFTDTQQTIWDNIPTICFVVLILAIIGLISSGTMKVRDGKGKVYRMSL